MKKKQMIWVVIIVVLLIVIAFLSGYIFNMKIAEKNNSTKRSNSTIEKITAEVETTTKVTDYSKLEGNWKASMGDAKGSCSASFSKAQGNKINLSVTSISHTGRDASIDVIVTFNGNIGSFVFDDDTRGNSGVGTVTVKDDNVRIEAHTTKEAEYSNFSMECNYDFVQKTTKDTPVDLSKVDTYYTGLENIYGTETSTYRVDNCIKHTFGNLVVMVIDEKQNGDLDGYVKFFKIKYTDENKDHFNFKGINGNSDRKTIYSILGQPKKEKNKTLKYDMLDDDIFIGNLEIKLGNDDKVSSMKININDGE